MLFYITLFSTYNLQVMSVFQFSKAVEYLVDVAFICCTVGSTSCCDIPTTVNVITKPNKDKNFHFHWLSRAADSFVSLVCLQLPTVYRNHNLTSLPSCSYWNYMPLASNSMLSTGNNEEYCRHIAILVAISSLFLLKISFCLLRDSSKC